MKYIIACLLLIFVHSPVFAANIPTGNGYTYFAIEKKKKLSKKEHPSKYVFNVSEILEGDHAYVIRIEKYVYNQIKFTMSDKEYASGVIFDPLEGGGFATFKFNGQYSKMHFAIGHIDGTEFFAPEYSGKTILRIYYDDNTIGHDFFVLDKNSKVERIEIPLFYCKKLVLHCVGGGGLFGISEIVVED